MASYIFGMFLTLIGPKRENSLNLLSLITYTVEAMIHLGHSVSNHPKKMKFETVPPQILMKIYTFGLYGQKRRFAK